MRCVEEKGPHINLTSSGEAYKEALHPQRPKLMTKDDLKLKDELKAVHGG